MEDYRTAHGRGEGGSLPGLPGVLRERGLPALENQTKHEQTQGHKGSQECYRSEHHMASFTSSSPWTVSLQ